MDVYPKGSLLKVYPFQIHRTDSKKESKHETPVCFPAKEFILHEVHASKDHHQVSIVFDYMSMVDSVSPDQIARKQNTF